MTTTLLPINWLSIFDPARPRKLHYVIHGGRGGGKSWGMAAEAVNTALREPGTRIACVRETMKSLDDSLHTTICEVIQASGCGADFIVHKNEIICLTGSRFSFHGLSESTGTARRFKSTEGINLTLVEEAQDVTHRSLELLTPTVIGRREGARIIYALNPTHEDDAVYERFLLDGDPNALTRAVSWRDNPAWTVDAEAERLFYKERKPHLYGHLYDGELRREVEGALWSSAMVDAARMTRAEFEALADPDRIVVSVDPAGTVGKNSDYTGITVNARIGSSMYVLWSDRVKATPAEWARIALEKAAEYRAWKIVVEVTGAATDALPTVVRQIDPSVRVEGLSASGKGSKYDRAAPFATMTEEGRLWLVGRHARLEDEMLTFTLDSERDDLVDSMVWGGHGLGLGVVRRDISGMLRRRAQ